MFHRNFHTHTHLCKHASGTPADYCRAALEQGVTTLGFTDHTPHPGDDLWFSVRMRVSELPQYVAELDEAKRQFPQLEIFTGMECEYIPEEMNWYREELLGRCGLQYLIDAPHHFRFKGEWKDSFVEVRDKTTLHAYTDEVIDSLQSGLFAFLAHPDVFGQGHRSWDNEASACAHAICQACIAAHIPMEINANGFRKPLMEDGGGLRRPYPLVRFWEIAAEYPVEVLCSSDAHSPDVVWGNTDDCSAFARFFGLKVVNQTFSPRPLIRG